EALAEGSQDAGSIPAASTQWPLTIIGKWPFFIELQQIATQLKSVFLAGVYRRWRRQMCLGTWKSISVWKLL
ncbi:hypothetical protein, partial [uncultured Gimesia sp.]|uniref:hypothetical protein n=1 Tax=uncultured Gimesia sp. TaxID=1678688 RepID=UPI0030DD7B44